MDFEFWKGAENLPIWGFLIRALIVYIYMFVTIKILGQRSIGTIHPLDFLFGVIIGDILGSPLASGDVPMGGALASATLIATLHLGLSFIALKTPRFRRIIEDEPIILIEKGRILEKQLRKTKVTVESLLMDLRLRSAADLREVDYAILESNGQISVIKKSNYDNATPDSLNLPPVEPKGYATVLILDGKVVERNLAKVGTRKWLEDQIKKHGLNKVEDIFLLTMNEAGKIYISEK